MNPHQTAVQRLISRFVGEQGGLLPLLHAIQDELGFIPETEVASIARGMNLSRAEVHGVITYYHHFRMTPPTQHQIHVCMAEACKACGADAVMAAAQKCLARKPADFKESVTLEPVYCLGLCSSSPAMLVNEKLHARMSVEKMESLLQTLEQTQ